MVYKRTCSRSKLLRSLKLNTKKIQCSKVADKLIWLDYILFLKSIIEEAENVANDGGVKVIDKKALSTEGGEMTEFETRDEKRQFFSLENMVEVFNFENQQHNLRWRKVYSTLVNHTPTHDKVLTTLREKKYIIWSSRDKITKGMNIEFDGVPYIIAGRRRFVCQHGFDMDVKRKRKAEEVAIQKAKEKNVLYVKRQRRSKKLDCPAIAEMMHIIKLTDYFIPPDADTPANRRRISLQIRTDHANGMEELGYEQVFLLYVDKIQAHSHHIVEINNNEFVEAKTIRLDFNENQENTIDDYIVNPDGVHIIHSNREYENDFNEAKKIRVDIDITRQKAINMCRKIIYNMDEDSLRKSVQHCEAVLQKLNSDEHNEQNISKENESKIIEDISEENELKLIETIKKENDLKVVEVTFDGNEQLYIASKRDNQPKISPKMFTRKSPKKKHNPDIANCELLTIMLQD